MTFIDDAAIYWHALYKAWWKEVVLMVNHTENSSWGPSRDATFFENIFPIKYAYNSSNQKIGLPFEPHGTIKMWRQLSSMNLEDFINALTNANVILNIELIKNEGGLFFYKENKPSPNPYDPSLVFLDNWFAHARGGYVVHTYHIDEVKHLHLLLSSNGSESFC
ncbi:hypothetical protein ACJX0J_009166 [Zea mays]